jgi:hypothetical protein
MINIDDFKIDKDYNSFSIAFLYKKIEHEKIDISTIKNIYNNNITVFEPEKFTITVLHSFSLLEKMNVYKQSPYYEDYIFLVDWHSKDKSFYEKYNKIAGTNFDVNKICCAFVSQFLAFPTMLAMAVLMKYNPNIPALIIFKNPMNYENIYSVFYYKINFEPKITKKGTFKTKMTYIRKH